MCGPLTADSGEALNEIRTEISYLNKRVDENDCSVGMMEPTPVMFTCLWVKQAKNWRSATLDNSHHL